MLWTLTAGRVVTAVAAVVDAAAAAVTWLALAAGGALVAATLWLDAPHALSVRTTTVIPARTRPPIRKTLARARSRAGEKVAMSWLARTA
jgi:hypothetical protein